MVLISPFLKNLTRKYSVISNAIKKMMYLGVAEKNDAAKTIAQYLSGGSSNRREGLSPYNKIYEFDCNIRGQASTMAMTSVSGHLLTHDFVQTYRNWRGCSPEQLFEAPVTKFCPDNYVKIKLTLEREIVNYDALIIWTDCDREGENIGFEIIQVCRAIKPNIQVYRAKFSDMTAASIHRAVQNLGRPDERQSLAVDVRSELDLRIGAAFTRFQTMRLQQVFPSKIADNLVSYGSCQIPTLGFVADRYKEVENFIPQTFWKIKLTHKIEDLTVEFNWSRNRLFDKQCCEAFLMVCQAAETAMITSVSQKPKSKWRPLPMDTIELEKSGVRKLKLNAKTVMTIAEKLYTQGLISYPRTETNKFSDDMDLAAIVEQQTPHPDWGGFADKVLEWGMDPRAGNKSDQAHPPIHPTKFTTGLTGDEARVYELVVRHFLACVSRDAKGSETSVEAEIGDETFTATGLMVLERNYLEVYVYERWSDKEIHHYEMGDTFTPTELGLHEGNTTAPSMLTEADLIALMEKHGIGTDATHAEHINTIKERGYIGEIERGFLLPGTLGMGLVEGYTAMELTLAQPKLRADLEKDLKLICEGIRDPQQVLREQIQKYKECYRIITERAQLLDNSLASRFQENAQPAVQQPEALLTQPIFKCPKCNDFSMALKQRATGGFYVSCEGFPSCKNAIWLPDLKEISVKDENCRNCGSVNKKILVKFKQPHFLGLVSDTAYSKVLNNTYETCLVCDAKLRELLNISADTVKRLGNVVGVRSGNAITNSTAYENSRNSRQNPSSTRQNSSAFQNPTNSRQNPTNSRQNPTNSRQNPTNPSNRQNGSSGWGSSNQNRGWGNNNDRGDDDDFMGGGGGGAVAITNNNNRSAGSSGWGRTNISGNQPNTDWRTSNSSWNSSNDSGSQRAADNRKRKSVPLLDISCNKCNKPAIRMFVKKDGPNKGRPFYKCENNACNFFKWGDENLPPTGGGSGGSGGSYGSSDGAQTSRGGGTRRKCGICRQEGHTKNKCPQKQDY